MASDFMLCARRLGRQGRSACRLDAVRAKTGVLATATTVPRISTNEPSDGETVTTFASEVQPGCDIGGNANGGDLMAIAGRAMSEAAGRGPVTLAAHDLRPAQTGLRRLQAAASGRRRAEARDDGTPGELDLPR